MFNTQVKTLTAASVALVALMALGACDKKLDDTGSVPAPSPRTGSSTGSSSGSSQGSSGMGSGSAGYSMPAPMSPASSSR